MTQPVSKKIYFVMGEESGDVLGSNLMDAFSTLNAKVTPIGLGGQRMQQKGLHSLFDISELSVMGISGVLAKLPKLLGLIKKTADDVIRENPDVLLLIDSPDFSYRVAKRVRKKAPNIKIVKYVAPSVWAWRPGRAASIKPYIDHILAILPFEPELLSELGGPPATYVGHPLSASMPKVDLEKRHDVSAVPKLVVLPGSRNSEVKRLLPFIRETLETLKRRGNQLDIVLPAVSKLESQIRSEVEGWPYPVRVVTGDEAKLLALEEADLALAASGTVTLELALHGVPMISIYKLDALAMRIRHLLTGWTASLPNLIADYPVVPERFNEYAHPLYVARMIERLSKEGHERSIQIDGFDLIRKRLAQETPGFELAASKILELSNKKAD